MALNQDYYSPCRRIPVTHSAMMEDDRRTMARNCRLNSFYEYTHSKIKKKHLLRAHLLVEKKLALSSNMTVSLN